MYTYILIFQVEKKFLVGNENLMETNATVIQNKKVKRHVLYQVHKQWKLHIWIISHTYMNTLTVDCRLWMYDIYWLYNDWKQTTFFQHLPGWWWFRCCSDSVVQKVNVVLLVHDFIIWFEVSNLMKLIHLI